MSASAQYIQPKAGEAYRQFIMRAHQALMRSMPDPDERNQAVWKSWYSVHGDPASDRAQEIFPPDQYRTVPNVCYFMEHSTKSRNGDFVSYDFNKLADIVDEHADRMDTDNYTAMTDGHTVDRPAALPANYSPPPQPDVVGYAGPYRLGMTGRNKPKFAVFADEHHMRSAVPKLDKKKRRSVEVNRFRDGRRPFFDPVAILGSEAPRLALPIARYSVLGEDGAIKERYEAPAMVSGTNSYIPEPIKDRHSSESQAVDMNPATSDQQSLIRNILSAFMQTNEMQFLRSMMQQQALGGTQPGGMPGGSGLPDPNSFSQPQPGSQPQPDQGPTMDPSMGDGGGNDDGAPGMSQNQNRQRYQVVNDSQRATERYGVQDDYDVELRERFSVLHEQHEVLTERYSQLEEANKANMREMAKMRQAVVQLEQRTVDAERTERIKDLYQQYQHAIDLDEELATCLYSHGSDMGSEAFEKHINLIEKMAKRSSPTTRMLPGSESVMSDKERNSAEWADRILERYELEAEAGNILSMPQVEALLRKEGAH